MRGRCLLEITVLRLTSRRLEATTHILEAIIIPMVTTILLATHIPPAMPIRGVILFLLAILSPEATHILRAAILVATPSLRLVSTVL